jgi:hypothetical protein
MKWGPLGRAASCDSWAYNSGVEQPQDPQRGVPGSGSKPLEDIGLSGELGLDVLEVRLPAEFLVKNDTKHAS